MPAKTKTPSPYHIQYYIFQKELEDFLSVYTHKLQCCFSLKQFDKRMHTRRKEPFWIQELGATIFYGWRVDEYRVLISADTMSSWWSMLIQHIIVCFRTETIFQTETNQEIKGVVSKDRKSTFRSILLCCWVFDWYLQNWGRREQISFHLNNVV